MAKQILTKLVDDIDGGVAAETVRFALDGRAYEIDLSAKNAKKLRTELATFVEHGSRIATPAGRRGGLPSISAAHPDQNRTIRAWAQANGFDIAPRGRIRQEIVDAFHHTPGR